MINVAVDAYRLGYPDLPLTIDFESGPGSHP